ncbi:hypothetical protein PAHAL_9G179400 [Panicum hallii]|uniref:Uncharacterized protein n=1 Tax=Panicum hallii TaxID=206008 RepID=A0A2T8I1M2_9POAL|nr:hypothetical protein PAHAL_9G179400 [Panicum hallii]
MLAKWQGLMIGIKAYGIILVYDVKTYGLWRIIVVKQPMYDLKGKLHVNSFWSDTLSINVNYTDHCNLWPVKFIIKTPLNQPRTTIAD